MKKFFKWLLLLTFTLVCGAVIIIYNPQLIKGPLENYLSDVSGYPINLEGGLELKVGSKIEVVLTKVTVSAPLWAKQQNLISVAYLKLVLVSSSLFKDIVILDSLLIDDLQVNLETKPDGSNNWTSIRPQSAKSDGGNGAARVVFNSIQLNKARLRFISGKKDLEHNFHIATLNQQQQADGMLQIALEGNYDDKPLIFAGNIGTYENLLNGTNVAFSGNGRFGLLKFKGSGLIDDLIRPRLPQFNIEVEGPDIDRFTAAFGFDDLGNGPFSLNARGGEIIDHYEASIDGGIGDITLSVSAQASDILELDDLILNMTVNGPSLGAFTRVFGLEKWPDKPFSLKAGVTRTGSTLNIPSLDLNIGGTHLSLDALLSNFPHLDASRIKLSIVGDDIEQFRNLLGIPGIASGPFKVSGKLDVKPDAVELLQIEIFSSLGHATLSGELGNSPKYLGSKLHLHLEGNNAHSVMSAFNVDALPEQPFNLDTRLEVVEQGIKIERGVLVTIEDERLELGGLLTLKPGSVGTSLDVVLNGKHLNRILRRLVANTEVPDQPYELSGHLQILEDGIQLENVNAAFAGISLGVGGKIKWGEQPLGPGLDFQLSGNDLSALGQFDLIGDSLDMFVPGQAYKATGRFSQETTGWRFDKVDGRVGETDLSFDALISNRPDLIGSEIVFSLEGPGLAMLLREKPDSALPSGAFKTNGGLSLSESTLKIADFSFETPQTTGNFDLELGWPLSKDIDARFDVNLQGDNIRHIIPVNDLFVPDRVAYTINATGRKQGDRISIKQADANIGNLQLQLTGKFEENLTNESATISFNASSPKLSSLGLINGKRLPDMPFALKADFNGNARQFVLDNIVGTLGDSQINGKLDATLGGEKPIIKVTGNSNYIDIRPFLPPEESQSKAVASNKNDRLIPSTPLPLDAMAAADVSLSLTVAELRHTSNTVRNIDLGAVIHSGQLKVDRLNFHGPRGTVEASFSIMPTSNKKADVQVDLHADGLVLNLSNQDTDKLDQAPKIDIRLNASGHGSNLQEIAGSTNGSLSIGSRGGVLEGVDLSILDTFILDEIFSLILPKSEIQEDLGLTCAAAILKITDGMIKTTPAVAFTTSKITLVSKGTIDLKTEKMKLNFNATPNNALKLSASELFNPYILVGGTLSNPAVGLDPAKVILHGGAAIGTAGISILAKGLLDRVSTTMPICEDMLEIIQAEQ